LKVEGHCLVGFGRQSVRNGDDGCQRRAEVREDKVVDDLDRLLPRQLGVVVLVLDQLVVG